MPALYRKQGELVGQATAMSDDHTLTLDFIVENIVNSSAIEGEFPDVASVRSSLANHLGLEEVAGGNLVPVSDQSEGLALLVIDALTNTDEDITQERLFQWHSWLFPEKNYPYGDVNIGAWRIKGTMQVVSGNPGKPKIHFQAPPTNRVTDEMDRFLAWFNSSRTDPALTPVERAAMAHLWFVTVHPFDDGNGRIARAISDLALAQDDPRSIHLHAMSAAILGDRKGYYNALEQT